jgi:hypothetical protein
VAPLKRQSESGQEIIYGVNLPRDEANLRSSYNVQNQEDQTPPVELIITEMGMGKVLSKTGKALSKTSQPALAVDNPSSVPKTPRAFSLPDSDRITKVIVLRGGTLVISTVSSTRNGHFNHLISTVGTTSTVTSATNLQFTPKKVLGFESSSLTVESLLNLPKNQILCLVGTEGIPPFTFRMLDFRTGEIYSGEDLGLPTLSPNSRFSNLCQDQKGNIFATKMDSEGIPILISMNLQERAIVTGKAKMNRLIPLTFEGSPLFNDVKDLNFSSSGQLHALAADKSGNNALFAVDMKTGKMELVSNFAAEKFAFSL